MIGVTMKSDSNYRNAQALNGNDPITVIVIGVSMPQPLTDALPRQVLDPQRDKLKHVSYDDLTADLLVETGAQLILSPVVSEDFDAVELAHRLVEINFSGRYLAVAKHLAHPEMIRREVTSSCKTLDFDLIVLDQGPKLTPM